MQLACIEGVRNLAGIEKASSTEFGPTDEPVVGLITEWMAKSGHEKRESGGDLGGTMRPGAYPAQLAGNSVVASIYGTTATSDRHRQRYEVNNAHQERLEEGRPVFSALPPDRHIHEIVRRPHPLPLCRISIHPEQKQKT